MKETVYRRFGSPEVDSAWEALGIECTYNFMDCILHIEHSDRDQYESG